MRADARRNRARILDAARELFAERASPSVQIDDVARRAGVGVGTVYRHFPDKEALMGELVRERFELFNARLRAALADERCGAVRRPRRGAARERGAPSPKTPPRASRS